MYKRQIYVIEAVDRDQPDAGIERQLKLAVVTRIAMKNEARRTETGPQREVKLTGGGDVAVEALLCEHAHHGGRAERLGGKNDAEVVLPGGFECRDERSRPGAQVVLGDDVGRRAEAVGELEHITAADLEPAPRVQAAVDRIDMRKRLGGGHAWRLSRLLGGAERRRSAAHAGFAVCDHFPMAGKRSQFGKDRGLQGRMLLTMFLLGLVYVVLIGALIASGASGVTIAIVAVALFGFQLFASDKLAMATLGARTVTPQEAPELHAIVERLCIQADLPKPRVAIMDHNMPNAFATGRSQKLSLIHI